MWFLNSVEFITDLQNTLHYTLVQDKGYNKKTQEARKKVHAQDSRDHVPVMHPTQIMNSMEMKFKKYLEKHSCTAVICKHTYIYIYGLSIKMYVSQNHSREQLKKISTGKPLYLYSPLYSWEM